MTDIETTTVQATVATVKPLPDLSSFSAKKRVALLRCWTGASKTDEAKARFAEALAAAESDLAQETEAQALAKREAVELKAAAKAQADADAAAAKAAKAQAATEAKAAKAAEEAAAKQAKAEAKAAAKAAVATGMADILNGTATADEVLAQPEVQAAIRPVPKPTTKGADKRKRSATFKVTSQS